MAKTPAAARSGRLQVLKTYKMYVGGAFIRSESGKVVPALSPDGQRLYFSSQRNPGRTYEVSGPWLGPKSTAAVPASAAGRGDQSHADAPGDAEVGCIAIWGRRSAVGGLFAGSRPERGAVGRSDSGLLASRRNMAI